MRVISFDKGSKRQIQGIRWKRSEIMSAVLLSLITIVFCVFFALWEMSRYSAQSQTHPIWERR